MGRIGKVLSVTSDIIRSAKASIIKASIGGGEVVSTPIFSAGGEDSPPMQYDDVLLTEMPSRGVYSCIGSLDPLADKKSQPGEKRIYARDSSGVLIAEIWLKSTGEVIISNVNGLLKMLPDGTIDANGVTIDPSGSVDANGFTIDTSGNISTSGTITCQSAIIGGITFSTHVHPGVTTGTGSTGTPL